MPETGQAPSPPLVHAAVPAPPGGHRRLCVAPHRAVALLGLGPAGHDQARTALTATNALWAVPTGAPSAIDELPAEGSSL